MVTMDKFNKTKHSSTKWHLDSDDHDSDSDDSIITTISPRGSFKNVNKVAFEPTFDYTGMAFPKS